MTNKIVYSGNEVPSMEMGEQKVKKASFSLSYPLTFDSISCFISWLEEIISIPMIWISPTVFTPNEKEDFISWNFQIPTTY